MDSSVEIRKLKVEVLQLIGELEARDRLAETLLELLALRDLEVRLLRQANADAVAAANLLRDTMTEAMTVLGLDPETSSPSDFMAQLHELLEQRRVA